MSESTNLPTGFSSPKREALLLLKRAPDLSLRELAEKLGISKVAALRHLTALEKGGLVERSYRPEGVGRPRVHFRLTPESGRMFPSAYVQMSLSALNFIEERLGHGAVVELLQQRAHALSDQNRSRVSQPTLAARVAELARLRAEGGYMAELGSRRRESVELFEHNCPVLAIAQRYPEACEVERRMFESLLGARVEASHRVVAGDPVCRFLVRPRESPA